MEIIKYSEWRINPDFGIIKSALVLFHTITLTAHTCKVLNLTTQDRVKIFKDTDGSYFLQKAKSTDPDAWPLTIYGFKGTLSIRIDMTYQPDEKEITLRIIPMRRIAFSEKNHFKLYLA